MDIFSKRGAAIIAMTLVMLYSSLIRAESDEIKRADFYDASGNHLMYVTFVYDSKGNNIERNVYMSDGYFKRKTILVNNSSGKREKEVSFDFNDDTSFVTTIASDGGKSKFTVRDQFKVEQFGGDISYSGSGDDFEFFQNGSLINRMNYIGKRIEVFDKAGALAYYVELDNVPVRKTNRKLSHSLMSIQQRGNNRFVVYMTLSSPSNVSCDLISLSGKKLATLVSKNLVSGSISESVSMNSVIPGLADGIYIIDMSIDGKRVYRDKVLANSSGKGF